jgi:hypothetical protein
MTEGALIAGDVGRRPGILGDRVFRRAGLYPERLGSGFRSVLPSAALSASALPLF